MSYGKRAIMLAPVLLVEDDYDFASSLELALSLVDIQVERAGSGEAAIARIENGPSDFKIVFCDIKLPGIDGISCLEEILSRNKNIIGVVMTGFRDDALFERARNAGAEEILLKPFRMSEFMELAKKHLADKG